MNNILYINEHALQRNKERFDTADLISKLKKKNTLNELKIMNIMQTIKGKTSIKKALLVDGYIIILGTFKKDGNYIYKGVSLFTEKQFFTSVNLNFGIHSKPESIYFDDIKNKEIFIDNKYIYSDNKEWENNFISNPFIYKEIKIKCKNKYNEIIKTKKFPLFIKTFSNKIYKISL